MPNHTHEDPSKTMFLWDKENVTLLERKFYMIY